MVDGVFGRAFKSNLKPIELGRRLVRELDDRRTIDVKGRVVVPNHFAFRLHPADLGSFESIEEALIRELGDAAREYAADEGYTFMGPVKVTLAPDMDLRPGRFTLVSRLAQAAAASSGAGAALILADGTRHVLNHNHAFSIGRLPECTLALADTNVSRRHAEVRPAGDGWVVVDLDSTNGTNVNGSRVVGEQLLVDGDEIGIGTARLRFDAG
jgi:hypothetical protein